MIGDYDFSDTDCPDECEPGQCTCDEESPVPALIGAIVLLTAVFGALYAAFSA